MSGIDINAEREKIQREIQELERSLGPSGASVEVEVTESSLDSDEDDLEIEEHLAEAAPAEGIDWEDGGSEKTSSSQMEMCLQMNLVYQAVIEEKIQEVELLIAQNKEQQEEMLWELAGRKVHKTGDSKLYPLNLSIGHFLKPYFKDKSSGVGPPANQDARDRAAQGIKSFAELATKQWRSRDNEELRNAILSDSLQRMVQPKLFKLEYLNQKLNNAKSEMDKQILDKQIRETEREINDINQLPEEVLLGRNTDEHDWEKISKMTFDGIHSAEKLKRVWQNREHPHINKGEWGDDEVIKLQSIAEKHHHINWQNIANELGTSRTAFQCLQKYQLCNKDFKRKEFNKDEDDMLTQLVQEMRVGNHIPYQKISYFMEGRDAMQLLYRWSKSLDPNIKKGAWSSREDELLLNAVAKYGERNWYKIRKEVPGRSDMQCRERYLKGLHADVKKGTWSDEEKLKLVELVQKYGVGRWTKIATELTHRTGSQCLSKWKAMIGYKPKVMRRRKSKKKTPNECIKTEDSSEEMSSSSSSSSSSSEDLDMDFLVDSEEEEKKKRPKVPVRRTYIVPSMDRWIPRRPSRQGVERTLLKSSTSPTFGSGSLSRMKAKKREDGFQFTTMLKGIAYPYSTDMVIENPDELLQEAHDSGRQMLQIREEDVRLVLKRNTQLRQDKQVQRVATKLTLSAEVPETTDQLENQVPTKKQPPLPRRVDLYKDSVDRKLLLAVTPWVGNVLLPLSTSFGRTWRKRTQADVVRKTFYSAAFASTPAFTFFIQLFRIDADGCLRMIQARKPKQQTSTPAKTQPVRVQSARAKAAAQPCSNVTAEKVSTSQNSAVVQAPRPKIQRTQVNPVPPRPTASAQLPVKPHTPAQKPKTVYELLKEKRLMASRAKRAAQKTVLVSQNMLLVHPQPSATSHQQSFVMPLTPSPKENRAWPAMPFIQLPTNQVILNQPLAGASGSLGNSGADASGQALGGTSTATVGNPSNISIANSLCTAQALPASPGPIRFIPTVLSSVNAPRGQSSNAVPFTWLVTPQGLVPVPMQALGIANQIPQVAKQSSEAASISGSGNETVNSTEEPIKEKDPQSSNGSCSPALTKPSSSGIESSVSTHSSPPSATEKLPESLPSGVTTYFPPVSAARSPVTPVVHSPPPTDPQPSTPPTAETPSVTTNPTNVVAKKYPVVKIAKLLSPSHPKYQQVIKQKVAEASTPSKDPQTPPPSAEKKALDVSLVSLEDEVTVKEWLQGKQGVDLPDMHSGMAYLPPSICNLKTLSKLLLQKTTLEERAFKLVPANVDEGERNPAKKQEIINGIVDQRLKDNPAYLLLKQRFLSAFTFPALLATLPPTKRRAAPVRVKREASDEDSDDSADNDISRQEDTDEDPETDTEAPAQAALHEVPAVSGQKIVAEEETREREAAELSDSNTQHNLRRPSRKRACVSSQT